jgi:hypothetical protein
MTSPFAGFEPTRRTGRRASEIVHDFCADELRVILWCLGGPPRSSVRPPRPAGAGSSSQSRAPVHFTSHSFFACSHANADHDARCSPVGCLSWLSTALDGLRAVSIVAVLAYHSRWLSRCGHLLPAERVLDHSPPHPRIRAHRNDHTWGGSYATRSSVRSRHSSDSGRMRTPSRPGSSWPVLTYGACRTWAVGGR